MSIVTKMDFPALKDQLVDIKFDSASFDASLHDSRLKVIGTMQCENSSLFDLLGNFVESFIIKLRS